jgi:indolepyruvate ferredoxin oxidoreductase beta subunit
VVLLGAATRAGALGLTTDDVERVVRNMVPERFLDLNLRALSWE